MNREDDKESTTPLTKDAVGIRPNRAKLVSGDVAQITCQVLANGGGAETRGQKITIPDLAGIPAKSSQKRIENFIKSALNEKDTFSKESIRKINECFRFSLNMWENDFLMPIPSNIKKIEFTKKKDVMDFISHTKAGGSASNSTPYYCAIAILSFIEWEYQKHEFQELSNETEYFHNMLLEEMNYKDGNGLVFDSNKRITGFLKDNQWRPLEESNRSKEHAFTNIKMLIKREFDLHHAITDGIGFRFTPSSRKNAMELIPIILEALNELRVSELNAKNNNLINFESEGGRRTKKHLEQYGAELKDDNNPKTAKTFRDFKILGTIPINKDGNKDAIKRNRKFEIQIFTEKNKNEIGLSNHNVYDEKKILLGLTKLIGSFKKEVINAYANRAFYKIQEQVKKDMITLEEAPTLAEIQKELLSFVKPVSKNRYAVPSVWEEWENLGMA